jgi:hypothetical protein
MNKLGFFSVSGVACAPHTLQSKKIWQSLPDNKSAHGRAAILNYARDEGFKCLECDAEIDVEIAKEAFEYLANRLPDVSGKKSFILRTAIINFS